MSRKLRIATCQLHYPDDGESLDSVVDEATPRLAEAGEAGADICCLPEALNCAGQWTRFSSSEIQSATERLERATQSAAAKWRMYVVLPLIANDEHSRRRNLARLIDRGGNACGIYSKVHLTGVERDEWRCEPGESYPIFKTDFGVIGIMICYDGCFPEVARILTLKGAEIVFWPSLQRSYTEDILALQVRSRAYDNQCFIVRSSYGTRSGLPWRPGRIVGKSCVAAPDGTIISDLGKKTGTLVTEVDLDDVPRGPAFFEGPIVTLREARLRDRRPETYAEIVRMDHVYNRICAQ